MQNIESLLKVILKEQEKQTKILQSIVSRLEDSNQIDENELLKKLKQINRQSSFLKS